MVAGEPQEGVAPEGDWQQVSVFLSVVDVHVNRSPYRGEVVESSYRKGSFLAAYRKESAHRNERSELWLRDGDRTVVFRQIVGVLARRIVTRTGAGPAAGHRRADGPDEVRLADGRLRAAGVHAHRDEGTAGARRRDRHRPLARGRLRSRRATDPAHDHRRVRPRLRPRHPTAGPGDPAQPVHARQHVLRLLRDPGVDPRRVRAGRRPDRAVGASSTSPTAPSPGWSARSPRSACSSTRWPTWCPSAWPRRCWPSRCSPRAATSGTRSAGWPASSGWPARRSGWPGSTRPSTRPPTSGTSPACPAPGRPAWCWPRCSRSATRCRAATGCGCCWSSSSRRC